MTFIIVGAFVVAAIVAVALLSKKKKPTQVDAAKEVLQTAVEEVAPIEQASSEILEPVAEPAVQIEAEAKPKKATVKKATVKKAVKPVK